MATTDDLTTDVDPRDIEKPRGRTSFLTILLIALNIGGLVAFGAIMYLDMTRQEKWAKAMYMRHLALIGLPVDDRDGGRLGKNDTNPDRAAEPVHYLDPLHIRQAYEKRGLKPNGKFLEVREILKHNIRYPVDPDVLKQYFADNKLSDVVGTQKDELDRVWKKLPGDMDQVAGDVLKKALEKLPEDVKLAEKELTEVEKERFDKLDEAKKKAFLENKAKRKFIGAILYPTAVEGWQVAGFDPKPIKMDPKDAASWLIVGLELKLRAVSGDELAGPGKELDDLIVEAAKRKMLYDILKPMEVFRPSEPDVRLYIDDELYVDVDKTKPIPLDDLKVKKPAMDRIVNVIRLQDPQDKKKSTEEDRKKNWSWEVPTQQLMDMLEKRFKDVIADNDWIDPSRKRDNAEKRRAIAFLLLTISEVEVPGSPPPEMPKKQDKQDKVQPAPDAKDKDKDKDKEKDKDKDKDAKPDDKQLQKKDDQNGMVKFVDQDEVKKDEKKGDQPPPDQPVEDKDKKITEPAPKPEVPAPGKTRPPRNFAFANDLPGLRVEVVCGLHHFNQACTDLSIVTEIMSKEMVQAIYRDRGDYRYPLGGRIYDPPKFVDKLVQVMEDLKINLAGKEAAFKQDLVKEMRPKQFRFDKSDELLALVDGAMGKNGIVIEESPDDKKGGFLVKRMRFEIAVHTLLYDNAVGFTEKHQAAIKRIQDLASLIDVRKRELVEHENLNKERAQLLKARTKHEQEIFNKMMNARADTEKLAKRLKQLQQELFLAQIDLIGAHDYNLYLDQYLREAEFKLVKDKKGKGKGK
jgi:hypothetical protein